MSDSLPTELVERVRAEFDADFYLAANKDVADAGADPFAHFMMFGAREGRDPRPDFSVRRYLDLHVDVREAGVNAFVHWIGAGRAEGRATDHGLGFRYDVLWSGKPIEERLRDLRLALPDRPADDIDRLRQALAASGAQGSVHVTVSHDDYTTGVGGVQLCIRLEANAIRRTGADHVHLFPQAANAVVDVERDAPTMGVLLNGKIAGFFTHAGILDVLSPWLRKRTTTLAVHSLIGHAVPRLLEVLTGAGLSKGLFWLHDFSSLCAGYTLMRNDIVSCGAPPMDSAACEVCSYGRRRRIQVPVHVEFFQALDLTVVAPSRSALDLWRTRFPVAPARLIVHPHATLEPRAVQPTASNALDRPLRVAFLGMPSLHKGWPVFADLTISLVDDPRYEFHHLSAIQELRVPARFTRVSPTDAEPQPMPAAVEALAIDVVVIWSLWPETFCLAALEGLAAGAAVLTNPSSGNVVDIVNADPARGRVIADEAALLDLFVSGDALSLSRAERDPVLFDMVFGGISADLIPELVS